MQEIKGHLRNMYVNLHWSKKWVQESLAAIYNKRIFKNFTAYRVVTKKDGWIPTFILRVEDDKGTKERELRSSPVKTISTLLSKPNLISYWDFIKLGYVLMELRFCMIKHNPLLDMVEGMYCFVLVYYPKSCMKLHRMHNIMNLWN